ncbi:DUF1822 family protein [Nodosilinea sp. LEGE 07088]|uniref:DUF1822 family protein n=1 Tax=Nodosilinea sp. LEGE 07088 TaxID=2777968 RepID=UPI001881C872|nr:DUF1822 family protein [Nodosilinea sp. LEGE 07088]MBE9137644.1 DUF1822 family protein [Nodosilinea sp. LEGE 07088]
MILSERHNTLSPFPILLRGDFSDIWLLINAMQGAGKSDSGQEPMSPDKTTRALKENVANQQKRALTNLDLVGLSQWFYSSSSEEDWHSPQSIGVQSHVEAVSRSRVFSRAKLIRLTVLGQQDPITVGLIISVGNPSRDFNVTVELVPVNDSLVLPNSLRFQILDAMGACVEEEVAYNTPNIAMQIEGEETETFNILLQYYGFEHRESFVL